MLVLKRFTRRNVFQSTIKSVVTAYFIGPWSCQSTSNKRQANNYGKTSKDKKERTWIFINSPEKRVQPLQPISGKIGETVFRECITTLGSVSSPEAIMEWGSVTDAVLPRDTAYSTTALIA